MKCLVAVASIVPAMAVLAGAPPPARVSHPGCFGWVKNGDGLPDD